MVIIDFWLLRVCDSCNLFCDFFLNLNFIIDKFYVYICLIISLFGFIVLIGDFCYFVVFFLVLMFLMKVNFENCYISN